MRSFFGLLIACFFWVALSAQADEASFKDPCVGKQFEPNSWKLEVNIENKTPKAQILDLFQTLTTTEGFKITSMMSFAGEIDFKTGIEKPSPSKLIHIKFESSSNEAEAQSLAEAEKLAVLKKITELKGTSLECEILYGIPEPELSEAKP